MRNKAENDRACEVLRNATSEFINHFNYHPEFPEFVNFDVDAYAAELHKCVEDNFDYTIEKYGTVVTDPSKRRTMKIIVD